MLVALAILVAVQGLGNLLVVAVLVAPAAAARQVTRRVPTMMAAAVAIAVAAGVAGLYASFYLDTAAGASIAARARARVRGRACGAGRARGAARLAVAVGQRHVLQPQLPARDELAVRRARCRTATAAAVRPCWTGVAVTRSSPSTCGRRKSVWLASPTAYSPRSITASDAPMLHALSTAVV